MIKLTEEYYLVKRFFRFVRRIEKGARFRVWSCIFGRSSPS